GHGRRDEAGRTGPVRAHGWRPPVGDRAGSGREDRAPALRARLGPDRRRGGRPATRGGLRPPRRGRRRRGRAAL
ncbi:MAG: hypothetical protein AVDCRST_MAG49-626, partial [uncultured Thermomicrobiales bacterium]